MLFKNCYKSFEEKSIVHGDILEIYLSKGEKILDFASNLNPFRPKDLREKIISAIEGSFYYPHNDYSTLVDAISGSTGWDKKSIVFGNGSIELIEFFLRILKREVAIVQPTFTEYERFARIYGLDVINLRWNLDDIISFIKERKPEAVVICNPNNPTGDYFREYEMSEIAECCISSKTKLMVDQAFMDFVKPHDIHAFQIRSLTKILGIPGLRFGYGSFPDEYGRIYHERRMPWNVNCIAKAVAEEYLPRLRAFSRYVRRKISHERDHMKRKLKNFGFVSSGKANFLLCSGDYRADELFRFLEEKSILIRKCSDFKGLTENHFRVAVRKREENRALLKSLEIFVQENS